MLETINNTKGSKIEFPHNLGAFLLSGVKL